MTTGGIAIQIGAYTEVEYAYLLNPNWQEVMQTVPEIKHLPTKLQVIENWSVYAIDCDPSSCLYIRERYPDVHCINAYITGNKRGIRESYLSDAFHILHALEFYDISDYQGRRYFISQTPFDDIISSLELTHIDVLAVDIESAEVELFENYSWCIKPRFLAIEFHDCFLDISRIDFEEVILNQGYRKIKEERTNFSTDDNTYHTTELQFMIKKSEV